MEMVPVFYLLIILLLSDLVLVPSKLLFEPTLALGDDIVGLDST